MSIQVTELHGSDWSGNNIRDNDISMATADPPNPTALPSSPTSYPMVRSSGTYGRQPFLRSASCDLFEYMKHNRISEVDALYIFAQVVSSVFYLDSSGICHRDIKDENIVIDDNLMVRRVSKPELLHINRCHLRSS